jgi:signal transduction histidine kinase
MSGNEGRLHQAFLNILSNAEQAIPDNGTIRIKTSRNDTGISIAITDTGIGIPEENLPRISEPFFTTKPPGQGTGLGLSITYSILEEHGGKVSLKSEVNKGTEFLVLFSLQKSR